MGISFGRRRLKKDESVRSLENPILAIFDLADDVNSQLPQVQKALRISLVFMAAWLIVFFVFMLVGIGTGNPLLLLFFLGLFAIVLYAEYFIYHTIGFLDYFAARHRTIRLARDADPIIHIPRGRDSVDSFLTFVKSQNQRFAQFAAQYPHLVHQPVLLTGASGVTYHFDAYAFRPASSSFRWLGAGDQGYAFFLKSFPHAPTMREIDAVELGVRDVSQKTGILPNRVVILVETPGEVQIADDVYEHVTKVPFEVLVNGRRGRAALQIITQDTDGTYDFVPVVTSGPADLL